MCYLHWCILGGDSVRTTFVVHLFVQIIYHSATGSFCPCCWWISRYLQNYHCVFILRLVRVLGKGGHAASEIEIEREREREREE